MHRNCHLLFLFLTLTAFTLGQAQQFNCPSDRVSFEMVTGYVYTAPQDMLDSQPGTLMLTDCIDTCKANSSCRSINYETGLCVLFSSNADDDEGIFCVPDLIEIHSVVIWGPNFILSVVLYSMCNRWNKSKLHSKCKFCTILKMEKKVVSSKGKEKIV